MYSQTQRVHFGDECEINKGSSSNTKLWMYIFGVSQPLYVDNIFTDSEKSYDNGVITPKTKLLTGIQTDRQGSLNLFKKSIPSDSHKVI